MQSPMSFFRERKETGDTRTVFRLFGITVQSCRYRYPQRPTGGTAIGILRSYWISTKKRARGFGKVQAWAMLDYLDLTLPQLGTFSTVVGDFALEPNIKISSASASLSGRERHDTIRIYNRNDVEADFRLYLHGVVEIDPGRELASGPPTATGRTSLFYKRSVPAKETRKIEGANPDRITNPPVILVYGQPAGTVNAARLSAGEYRFIADAVSYSTEPTGQPHWSEIGGRPEW